jgi:phage host-nuclease inhibitor protein Gam
MALAVTTPVGRFNTLNFITNLILWQLTFPDMANLRAAAKMKWITTAFG